MHSFRGRHNDNRNELNPVLSGTNQKLLDQFLSFSDFYRVLTEMTEIHRPTHVTLMLKVAFNSSVSKTSMHSIREAASFNSNISVLISCKTSYLELIQQISLNLLIEILNSFILKCVLYGNNI